MIKYKIRLQIYNILSKLVSYTSKLLILRMIEKTAKEAGIALETQTYKEGLAVIAAESGFNPKAINRNVNGTVDYGLCQFNDYWYWEKENVISPQAAMDPKKALYVFWRYFPKRKDNWTTYKTGVYKKYIDE